jgi:hypothetical protein
MTRTTEHEVARVPEALVEELAQDDNEGFTMSLLSVRPDGWPHQALLSVGEVVMLEPGTVRVGLWPEGTAAVNLARRGQATLCAIANKTAYAVALELTGRGRVGLDSGDLEVFDGAVMDARTSVAPYADLLHGPEFRLHDPNATIARWRDTRGALRSMGSR